MPAEPLLPGRDYTVEGGLYVFTADFLRRRGYCCENACRNCPYGFGRRVASDEEGGPDDVSRRPPG